MLPRIIKTLRHKIVALNETIKTMKQIDETIDSHTPWPIKLVQLLCSKRAWPTGRTVMNESVC